MWIRLVTTLLFLPLVYRRCEALLTGHQRLSSAACSLDTARAPSHLSHYGNRRRYSPLPRSFVHLSAKPSEPKDDFDIDDVTKEAEEALKAAQASLEGNEEEKKIPEKPAVDHKAVAASKAFQQTKLEMQSDAIAAAVSSAFIGTAIGTAAVLEISDLTASVDSSIPPVLGAAVLAGSAFVVASQDSKGGRLVRNILGRPTKAVGKFFLDIIKKTYTKAAGRLTTLPGEIADATKRKVELTVKDVQVEITALPKRVSKAAVDAAEGIAGATKRKVELTTKDVKAQIKALPKRVSEAAVDAAEDVVEAIKAAPSRIAKSTRVAVEKTVDKTKQNINRAVEGVKALPARKINEISGLLEGDKRTPDAPKPPKTPPPKSLVQDEVARKQQKPAPPTKTLSIPTLNVAPPQAATPNPKAEPPKAETRQVDLPTVSVPKVSLPKVDAPKFDLPKFDLPKFDLPKVGLPKPDPAKAAAAKARESELYLIQKQVKAVAEEARLEAEAAKKEQAVEQARLQEERRGQQEGKAAEQARLQEAKAAEQVRLQEERRREQETKERRRGQEAKAAEQASLQEERQAKAAEQANLQTEERRRQQEAKATEQAGLQEERRRQQEAKAAEKARLQEERQAKAAEQEEERRRQQESKAAEKARLQEERLLQQEAKAAEQARLQDDRRRQQEAAGQQAMAAETARKQKELADRRQQEVLLGKKEALAAEEARKQELIRLQKEAKAVAEQRAAEQARLREERRQEQEAKVREAAEKRAAEQESRKAAAEQRAAEQARLREERRQEQEAKATEATEKRAAEQESRKVAAEAARLKAQKDAELKKQTSKASANTARPSFSVMGSPSLRVSSQRVSIAPRGVPTIVNWKKRRDSGISGRIYGSPNFSDGDRVETSEITFGEIANGSVVKTSSGSRYFLSDIVPSSPNAKDVENLKSARPGATITLTRSAMERDAKKAMNAVKEAKPRSTFSLFGMLSDEAVPPGPPAKKSGFKRSAPRGVPLLKRWRRNRDGSITGIISGSPNFNEGEQITTSPIANGNIDSKELVTTGSGSRYFLD
jgi:hypothetical protein